MFNTGRSDVFLDRFLMTETLIFDKDDSTTHIDLKSGDVPVAVVIKLTILDPRIAINGGLRALFSRNRVRKAKEDKKIGTTSVNKGGLEKAPGGGEGERYHWRRSLRPWSLIKL